MLKTIIFHQVLSYSNLLSHVWMYHCKITKSICFSQLYHAGFS